MVQVYVRFNIKTSSSSLARFQLHVFIFEFCELVFETENGRSILSHYTRQISKVVNCKLKRVGTLDRDMLFASCAMARGDIVMCFSDDAEKGCWKETGVINLKGYFY